MVACDVTAALLRVLSNALPYFSALQALASFRAEMKLQGLWDNVTIVQASEFGRTLTVNACGCAHTPQSNLSDPIRSSVPDISRGVSPKLGLCILEPQVNGLGTDHAWGGNTFVAGGSVKGARVHGRFPSDLSESGEEVIGRGRLVPTTSWEALWHAVAVRAKREYRQSGVGVCVCERERERRMCARRACS